MSDLFNLRAATLAGVLMLGLGIVPAQAATRGGTMTYARYLDSTLLDPVLNDSNADIWILPNIYNTLLVSAADGKGVEGLLATDYGFSNGGMDLVLSIRPGIKFSDGSDMTLDDVVWSLDRARDPKAGVWSFTLASVDRIEATGARQITIHLKHPDPTILPALTMFNSSVMPKKLVEAEAGATLDEKATAFAQHPVGTGPYVLKSWQRGVAMTLVPNPHYWRTGEDGKPLPYLDALKLTVVPDDATRILQLKSGQVDGIEQVPYAQVDDLKKTSSIRMELWPATRLTYLTVNARPTLKNGTVNPVGDVRVRQALQYALNKDAIIQISTHGLGTKMRSFIPSATPLSVGDKPLFDYDPAKAKALLADAGYAKGFPISCIGLANSSDELNNLTIVQQMWGQVGVKMTVEQMDGASRSARYTGEDFQCRVQFWTNDIADPGQVTSYVAYYPNVHSLHSGYHNPVLDALYEKSLTEADPKERAEDYRKIQEIFNPEGEMIYLYETPFPVAFTTKAKGFVQTPLGSNLFEKAYVDH